MAIRNKANAQAYAAICEIVKECMAEYVRIQQVSDKDPTRQPLSMR